MGRASSIRNMGELLSKLARVEADRIESHEDVSLHYAPSECHHDVERLYDGQLQDAIDEIERVTGFPIAEILEEAERRGWTPRGEQRVIGIYLNQSPLFKDL